MSQMTEIVIQLLRNHLEATVYLSFDGRGVIVEKLGARVCYYIHDGDLCSQHSLADSQYIHHPFQHSLADPSLTEKVEQHFASVISFLETQNELATSS